MKRPNDKGRFDLHRYEWNQPEIWEPELLAEALEVGLQLFWGEFDGSRDSTDGEVPAQRSWRAH